MPINGRQKGNRAEREVARTLQEWWRKVEGTCEMIRSPQSGGWSTDAVRSHFQACGDIMTTAKFFPFCVEVKHREAWSAEFFFSAKPTPAWGWWRQCLDAAYVQQAVPMMWVRRNYIRGTRNKFHWLVLVPRSFHEEKRLSSPDVEWSVEELQLNGVDFGVRTGRNLVDVTPVGYVYDTFLDMSPQRMRLQEPRDE